MPNYYCFYLDSNKIREFLITQKEGDSFILDSKWEPGITAGDQFVTFSKKGFKDFQFNEHGTIRNVELVKGLDEEIKTYRISYIIIKELEENNLLSELQYSLIRVYNYIEPFRHFTRSYVYLDEIDFYTIIEGKIFISRTALEK